jgi:hypothetical protein
MHLVEQTPEKKGIASVRFLREAIRSKDFKSYP